MKVLVISDTHGDTRSAEDVIRAEKGTGLVIHLGDYFRDAQKLSDVFPEVPFEYVYGNSDFMTGNVPSEKLLELEGRKILITHGHRYSLNRGYDRLHDRAAGEGIDLLLFGHTHEAYIERMNSYILLNPGSTSFPRGEATLSYAVVEIDKEAIKPCIIHIKT